jgi:hypothetical protein
MSAGDLYVKENTATIPAGGAPTEVVAWPNGSDHVLSGGWQPGPGCDGTMLQILANCPNAPNDGPPTGWIVQAANTSDTDASLTAMAVCVAS